MKTADTLQNPFALSTPVTSAPAATGWMTKLLKSWGQHQSVRVTVKELSKLSNHELNDLGISRQDIPRIAREAVYGK